MSLPYATAIEQFPLGDFAIDQTAWVYTLVKFPRKVKITSVRMSAAKACAAADTNYSVFTLQNGANVIATFNNGPVATGMTWAQGAFQSVTPVAAYAVPAAGDTLKLVIAKTGNGLAIAGVVIQLEYMEYDT
jgi:hypothetical protein